ncbi:MAG: hypothetical protein JXR73_09930 [Candidatus Omnitrophica bacterium]|nr:hypothetical protein [Candidatus Omnitrophota bacterium]
MAAKPSEQTILQTYSLNELLDLIKEKARLDAEEHMTAAREHLTALAKAMGGVVEATSKKVAVKTGARRGRPRKVDASQDASPKSARRGGKKIPLGQMLQDILGPEPMGIEEIMSALKANGYKSKSKDPRRVLYLELKKQVENNNIKKAGRGLYCAK